jgi:anti-sigma28 factor (negative regulator of flagellin synthesis)
MLGTSKAGERRKEQVKRLKAKGKSGKWKVESGKLKKRKG